MLKLNLITLSDYASVSREGKLSIDGIFDKEKLSIFSWTCKVQKKINLKCIFIQTDNDHPKM